MSGNDIFFHANPDTALLSIGNRRWVIATVRAGWISILSVIYSINRIVLTPVASFTERLHGLTAQSFGKTPEEIDKYIDRERDDR